MSVPWCLDCGHYHPTGGCRQHVSGGLGLLMCPCEQYRQPARGDHPHTDPGDGRTECDACGKWVWPVIHSCKGVPATAAALQRMTERLGGSSS